MGFLNRKVRLAILLALGVFIAFVAWRMGGQPTQQRDCTPGKQVERDAAGKVIRIARKSCR